MADRAVFRLVPEQSAVLVGAHSSAGPITFGTMTLDGGAEFATSELDLDSVVPVAARPQPAAPAAKPSIGTVAAATAIYAVPAAILLFITLVALARLIALRARADVLVDGHWLSAHCPAH